MRLASAAIVPLLLAASALAPAAAPAQDSRMQGDFVYDAAASDDPERAIERAIARMNFVTRPIARGRLRKTNAPYARVSIALAPGSVTTRLDGSRNPIVVPTTGATGSWTRDDGEAFGVRGAWRGPALEQTFVADDGQRVNLYEISPDGRTLEMRVTVTSPRLPAPVQYTLRYRRVE